ncbi:MAG: hypothetical protein DMF61_01890 [Blastocatellia bacterium AA13]|nr:MAG: hypothetical protein DMF61_01890 [Blastocatellia bacterium AA13]
MSFQEKRSISQSNRGRSSLPRVYSIASVLKHDCFSGSFEAGGAEHGFLYTPSNAQTEGDRLHLTGLLTISDSGGRARSRRNIRAVLAASQGGIGTAPPRKHSPTIDARPREDDRRDPLPDVESTGRSSFCGVMYFKLESVNGPALGVKADLSAVQMNVRLAPTTDRERELHGAYSSLIEALAAKPMDRNTVELLTVELNRLLSP